MTRWTVDPNLDVPPSRQLVETVLDRVASGDLAAGSQLPAVRALAAEALVNHNTVARAWRELEHLGVVAGENGRGVFVTTSGPLLARELRRRQTLESLDRAIREALRAGHAPEVLLARIPRTRRDTA
jgi:GntR family transcriptional regulator